MTTVLHAYFMAPLRCPAAMRRKAGALCGGYYATKGNIAQDGDVVTCPQCITELRRMAKLYVEVINREPKTTERERAAAIVAKSQLNRINALLPESEKVKA